MAASKNNNFGGLDPAFTDYKNAKVVILPVPYEGTVSYGGGTSKGPAAIIKASQSMELYDEELDVDTAEIGIFTAPPIKVQKTAEKEVQEIARVSKKFIDDGKFIFAFGGEHSISTGYIQEYKKKYPDLSVLQFDAHLDLRDSYDGTKFSHASIMHRVVDMGCKTVQIGIRSQSHEEADFVKEKGLRDRIYYANEIVGNPDHSWMDKAVSQLSDHVFITIDIDGFDPAYVPFTGTPEPGGIDWYLAMKLLKKVCKAKKIVGADITELAPNKVSQSPDFFTAKLAYKVMGFVFFPNKYKV